MAGRRRQHVPGVSDRAVEVKTGKDWAGWFRTLDQAGAKRLPHKTIAALLSERHGVPGWWSQMIALQYELARGLRARHQTATGYSVSVSKTVGTSLPKLYAMAVSPAMRRAWFPQGAFAPSSKTRNKYLRGAWNRTARLEFGFYAKGPGKAQIALGVTRLGTAADVEVQRSRWKQALDRLAALVEA
jgi:hypothetical protein